MSARDIRTLELLTCVVARTLRNDDVGFTGLATGSDTAAYMTGIPLAAMALAQRTHAPDLTILLAGWIQNPDLSQLTRLPAMEFLPDLLDVPCEAQMRGYPGPWSAKRGDITVGFSTGAQIDRLANLNSVAIGTGRLPDVRLVGPILQPEHMSLFGREIVMMPRHDRRRFVERVDYVSGVGWPGGAAGRRALGLERGGPALVLTPLCVFEIDGASDGLRVRSIHPGVTCQQLREATGFDLGDLSNAITTSEPTPEELRILRDEVDPQGALFGPRLTGSQLLSPLAREPERASDAKH